jgi:high affinity Mn2+ porin
MARIVLSCTAVRILLTLFISQLIGFTAAHADSPEEAPSTSDQDYSIHGQATVINQYHGPFNSPYSGPNSFKSKNEQDTSYTATLFLGYRISPTTEIYFNPEAAMGGGISDAYGLGAYTNGEVNRVGSQAFKIREQRLYVVETIPLGADTEHVEDSENQIGGVKTVESLQVVIGKFALNDFFDKNAYAQDPRTQFMNWCFMNNCGWDFAQDPFGYNEGAMVQVKNKNWALRGAMVMQPVVLESTKMARFPDAYGANVEGEHSYQVAGLPGTVRILVYQNRSGMRNFNAATQALEDPALNSNAAVIVPNRFSKKRGAGINLEQAINDSVGVFFRASTSDGRNEDWSFTDVDSAISGGVQVNGKNWGRPDDAFGVAIGENYISKAHQQYLNAGGTGIMLGDGKIDYAPEDFAEAYYSYQVAKIKGLAVSPDIQFFKNPGFNRDRGPVAVYTMRAHYHF